MKQIKQNGLTYLINEKEEKAEIVGYYENRNNYLIPRSINYESQEYIVVSISKDAFVNSSNIESIRFALDSELQTIENGAFSCSSIASIYLLPSVTLICEDAFFYCEHLHLIDIPSNSKLQTIEKGAFTSSPIESIFIPASLIDLKDYWCRSTDLLTKVKVDPNNPRYSYLEDKMIICKTSETNEKYDKIIFARRDIEKVKIPSFIKTIGSYAFEACKQLKQIDIPSNSELKTIEVNAFTVSSIESIFIPPSVTKISRYAFSYCQQLRQINIPLNSELQTIEENAFKRSSIESIFIPASVIDLKDRWCCETEKLTTVIVDQRNPHYLNYEGKMIICKTSEANEKYDKIIFARRDIEKGKIPSYIKTIGSCSFEACRQLKQIDIPSNSELQTIEEYAFNNSSIESIFIPPHVTKISAGAFAGCQKLRRIDISSNSELHTIEKNAFNNSSIESIFIPPHVTKIAEDTFSHCQKLRRIDIPSNSELQTIEGNAFLYSSIENIFIPPQVTQISRYAFFMCQKLHLIEIDGKFEIELYDIFPIGAIIMIPFK